MFCSCTTYIGNTVFAYQYIAYGFVAGGRRSQYIWPVQNTLTKQKFSNKHSLKRWLVINTNRWPVELEKKILTIKMAKTRRSQLRWLGLGAHNKDG